MVSKTKTIHYKIPAWWEKYDMGSNRSFRSCQVLFLWQFFLITSNYCSHLSNAILVLVPGEVYKYGANMLWIIPAFFINALIGMYVIFPTLLELKVTSFLEYIEKRYDSRTKYVALLLYSSQQIFLFAYVSYTSAIVLATGWLQNNNKENITPLIF